MQVLSLRIFFREPFAELTKLRENVYPDNAHCEAPFVSYLAFKCNVNVQLNKLNTFVCVFNVHQARLIYYGHLVLVYFTT